MIFPSSTVNSFWRLPVDVRREGWREGGREGGREGEVRGQCLPDQMLAVGASRKLSSSSPLSFLSSLLPFLLSSLLPSLLPVATWTEEEEPKEVPGEGPAEEGRVVEGPRGSIWKIRP